MLRLLCDRYDVSPEEARSLEPLVARAFDSEPDVRDHLLGLVEDALSKGAELPGQTMLDRIEEDLDLEVLKRVARALHLWQPDDGALGRLHLPPDLLGGGGF